MNLCKCCNKNIADATNTHYLTDSIIKTSFNNKGKGRDAGSIFEFSNQTPYVKYFFQRSTSTESIVENLGREATEEEIEESVNTLHFSVDNIFCSECEEKFGVIESNFVQKILPKIRELAVLNFDSIDEVNLIRRFFILQYFRTSLCDDRLSMSENDVSKFYLALFEENDELLKEIPLKITYLGKVENYEENLILVDVIENNCIIFFNDFIIQSHVNEVDIKKLDFFGLNNEDFNINSEYFNFHSFSKEEKELFREKYLMSIIKVTAPLLIENEIKMLIDFCGYFNLPMFSQYEIEEIFKELNQPAVFSLLAEKRYKTLSKILFSKIKK